jgi:maltose alpha-D-glucosyltransferase/alpha-amylase
MKYSIEDPLLPRIQQHLPGVLPAYLRDQRWFGGKAHKIQSVAISEVVPVQFDHSSAYLLLVAVEYESAPIQLYVLPLIPVSADEEIPTAPGERTRAGLIVAQEEGEPAFFFRDALYDRNFSRWLIESIRRGNSFQGIKGEMIAVPADAIRALWSGDKAPPEASVMKGEQSNTSLRYGDAFILKFYRRIEEGMNPELEIGRFLTDKADFKYTPPFAGAVHYDQKERPSATLAVLQGYVPNLGDAWRFTLDALGSFLEHVGGQPDAHMEVDTRPGRLQQWAYHPLEARSLKLLGPYLSRVQLLGRRTGELHSALASETGDPAFVPEEYPADYRQSTAASVAALAESSLMILQERLEMLPAESRHKASRVLSARQRLFSRLDEVSHLRTLGLRTRIHGDYHLGQVLVTEHDFAIIDFEGEPERPLADRRLKRSPLRDVAGMLRSFHYAASSVRIQRGVRSDSAGKEEPATSYWLHQWTEWVSAAFLQAYLAQVADSRLLPADNRDLFVLLQLFLLEKAMYELAYELKNRPDWVEIPLDGVLDLL